MNGISMSICGILLYNIAIRETLEYAIPKQSYDLKSYLEKKRYISDEITQETSLKKFFDNNKEKTKKIVDDIHTLIDNVYSDSATICKVANNELRVDNSQHLAIYDSVIELHEEIKKIVDGNLGFAKSKGALEEEILKFVLADERLYRTIAFNCLYHDLESLFFEYNKARNEAKGALTPQSNFIQGELNRVVKHIIFVRDHQSCTDNKYWDMVDYITKTIDWTIGRRALPEGKHFGDCFKEGHEIIHAHLKEYFDDWTPQYKNICDQLREINEKNKAAKEKAAASTANAEATPAANKETPATQPEAEKKDTSKLN